MNPDQINDFKTKLEALELELSDLAEAGKQGESTVELDQARVGRLSRMDALQGQAMSQETQRRRHVQLAEVRKALKRIELKSYGECQECGELIALARLEFKPEATCCVDCANKDER